MEQGKVSRKIPRKIRASILFVNLLLCSFFAQAQVDFTEAAQAQKFRLSVDYGWAWGFDKVDGRLHPAIQEYFETLNRSENWDFSFTYFGDGVNGFGAVYRRLHTEASLSDVTVRVDTSVYYNIELSDRVDVQFFAVSYLHKFISKSGKAKYLLGAAVGVITYDHYHHSIFHYHEEGSAFGSGLYVGIDYYLAKSLDLGFSVNAMFGELDEVEVAGQRYYLAEPISLLRLSVGLGLKLNF